MSHQAEVYQLLQRDDIDVIFDTALTGDGKTLAALLPLLVPPGPAVPNRGLFAYPTNELIRDQGRQVQEWARSFAVPLEAETVTGDELSDYQEREGISRFEAFLDKFQGRRCLITNPDLFHLVLSFHYVAPTQNPATLVQRLINRFRYLVFDEFHTYDAAQVSTLVNALLLAKAQSAQYPFKALFLSATPSPDLLQALGRAGLRVSSVQGRYIHGRATPVAHRLILRRARLEVHPNDGGILTWCNKNKERIRQFFKDHPSSRGLIIVNSVFTAQQLAESLRAWLPELKIATNTGLTGRVIRKESDDADLVVGTSSVDVGVDLHINLLVFESLDAATFLQRLGRLGRHDGFDEYLAIALLPTYLVERFGLHFADGAVVSRSELYTAVHPEAGGIFNATSRFSGFLPRWGTMQAMHKLFVLGNKTLPNHRQYRQLATAYQSLAESVFAFTRTNMERARDLFLTGKAPEIARELLALRGSGALDVWVYYPPEHGVAAVPLFRLLQGTDFRLIDPSEAERISRSKGRTFHKSSLNLYAVVDGFREERLNVEIRFECELGAPLGVAWERQGFTLAADHPAVRKIRNALKQHPVVTTVVRESPEFLRRRWDLPALFGLYRVTDSSNTEFTVAFGHEALLLDSLLNVPRT
ncbi:MAG: type I-D CRISPR-associated helicase Cas3' [Bacillota bacterium]